MINTTFNSWSIHRIRPMLNVDKTFNKDGLMVESAVLIGFTIILIGGMIFKLPLYIPLFFGFLLFFSYGLSRGISARDLFKFSAKGFKTIGGILVLFVLIGCLTASWRAAGTIPYITSLSSKVVSPSTIFAITFLIASAMGMVTGSAFATSATVGVICMTIGRAMGADPALMGGAVLSGAFFGDRTSPVSGSSNLVASLTKTDLFDNFNRMVRTALVPYLVCLVVFYLFGMNISSVADIDFTTPFMDDFVLNWYLIIPILIIIVLSLFRINVQISMLISLLSALVLCVFVQHVPLSSLPDLLFFGFKINNPKIAPMINGGGILSMTHIMLIIFIASTYAGLFEGTGLLNGLHTAIIKLSRRTTAYTGVLLTALVTTGISCDQTLSIMLTNQLCDNVEAHGKALALDLLNSSSLTAALMPWTTSCMGCLAFMSAPWMSSAFALFPMLMPAWFILLSWYEKKHPEFVESKKGKLLGFEQRDDVRRFLNSDGSIQLG